jgi:predicted DNA-binding transcriptional regulator AlpA
MIELGQPRLIYWRKDLQALLGISKRTLSRMISNRDIPSQDVCIRGRRGWKAQTILSWQEAGCPRVA